MFIYTTLVSAKYYYSCPLLWDLSRSLYMTIYVFLRCSLLTPTPTPFKEKSSAFQHVRRKKLMLSLLDKLDRLLGQTQGEDGVR